MTSSSQSPSIDELVARKTVVDYGEFRYVVSGSNSLRPRQPLKFVQLRHNSRYFHPFRCRQTRYLQKISVRDPTYPDQKLVSR